MKQEGYKVIARKSETNDQYLGHRFFYECALISSDGIALFYEYVNNRNEVKQFASKWKAKFIEYID